jgi:hypothetical protein
MRTKTDAATRWAPLAGDFDIEPTEIRFKGREFFPPPPIGAPETDAQSQSRALIGILAANRLITDGVLSARVRFADVTPATVCEFIFFLDRDRRLFVSAGFGGDGFAYGIRRFGPPSSPAGANAPNVWNDLNMAGDRWFLTKDREYEIEVRLQGGQITLSIDEVAIASTVVTALQGAPVQVGIFFASLHLIEVLDVDIRPEKPKAFVVMQFDGAFDELYHYVIREICEEFDVLPSRADEMVGPGVIMEDIVREIEMSRLIVADITPANLNVYYEVGYARALRKPIILLAQKGTKLPFDLAGFRVLFYENTIGGKARLDENLRKHIAEVLR